MITEHNDFMMADDKKRQKKYRYSFDADFPFYWVYSAPDVDLTITLLQLSGAWGYTVWIQTPWNEDK